MIYNDDEMRLKDLQVDGKGIFYYINEIKPLPVDDLVEISTVDLTFNLKHGNKIISPFVKSMYQEHKEDTLIELSKIIVSMFYSKWERTVETYKNELSLETYNLETSESIGETGSRSSNRTDVSTDERENKVSTFDDENYSNEGLETTSGNLSVTDTGSTEHNKTVTKLVKGNINNKLSDVNRYLNILQKDVFNDMIYTDVSQLLGLSIY